MFGVKLIGFFFGFGNGNRIWYIYCYILIFDYV